MNVQALIGGAGCLTEGRWTGGPNRPEELLDCIVGQYPEKEAGRKGGTAAPLAAMQPKGIQQSPGEAPSCQRN